MALLQLGMLNTAAPVYIDTQVHKTHMVTQPRFSQQWSGYKKGTSWHSWCRSKHWFFHIPFLHIKQGLLQYTVAA